MLRFISQRILAAAPVLLGILFVTFALARLLPGDPCRAMLGEKATAQICDAFNVRYGLNKPITTQFGIYLKDVARGDLGQSFRYGRPVTQLIVERLPVTVELSLAALIFATAVGILAGLWSAYRRNSIVDVATMVIANIGVSMPVFWLGLMLAYLFALTLKDTPFQLPPSGRNSPGLIVPTIQEAWRLDLQPGPLNSVLSFISNMHLFSSLLTLNLPVFWDTFRHMILPAVALGTIPLSIIARMTRSSLLDVLSLDYVRTARAKGLSEPRVVLRHGMRNALIPIVTIIGLSLGSLLGGAVLTETIFNLAGVGRILFDAIQARDYAIVQGFTLIIAAAYVVINLFVDLLYAFLDPRVRLG
ncbi:MAG: Dipeptide transport system permease protein DppB [Chloroflexi bacterium ADurb.Bin325]|nr:MAG: Dipeptide transport system permease protein DppB [Chloroflexi bacterium ADurb.Bin325]